MPLSSAANQGSPNAWQARDAAAWLALAASPTFALMAWFAANDAHRMALCAAGSSILPIDGMTAMYGLMSLFHLSPWLKLAAGRPAFGRPSARTLPITKGDQP
ncbi:MAG TPA: hypothetical protein VK822_31675 [Acetobacteraceae bacterium]|jgi:hypothetical protein|nr:hypothetical protein [Acetobacteraceae bacterium]HTB44177.1 hypothetical protein [Acetobacteraceae bacterium]